MAPNEAVYDERISPLVGQIIEICQEYHIPLVATFELGVNDENGETLNCSTVIELEHAIEPKMKVLSDTIYPPEKPLSMVTVRDGAGKITSMTAFI